MSLGPHPSQKTYMTPKPCQKGAAFGPVKVKTAVPASQYWIAHKIPSFDKSGSWEWCFWLDPSLVKKNGEIFILFLKLGSR